MAKSDTQITAEAHSFDRTVADLKQGVASVTAAHAEASEKAVKTARTFAALGQGTMEACTLSGQILAAGSQDLFRQVSDAGRTAVAEYLSGLRSLVGSKSVREYLELQASLTANSANWAVTEGTRFAKASIDLAVKSYAPLNARAVLTAETFASLKG